MLRSGGHLRGTHLSTSAQQLIVDGNGRDPLALPTLGRSADGQQGNQVDSALVTVEG